MNKPLRKPEKNIMGKLGYFCCAVMFLTLGSGSLAATPQSPHKVKVGVYVMDIYNLDLRKCTYTIDFYIWFRWQGNINPGSFEVVNGSLEQKNRLDDKEINGLKYICYRCRAAVHSSFNFKNSPFDTQELVLQIEDGDEDSQNLVYEPDIQNSMQYPGITIPGRKLGKLRCYAQTYPYHTNFGDPVLTSGDRACYSRMCVTVPLEHKGLGIYLKMFLALFISVATAFLAFLNRPDDLDPRFGVGVAAIFGAVSSNIVISQAFPEISNFTLADWLHVISLLFIFLSLLQSCITLRLWRQGRQALARKLDRISLAAFPLGYLFVVTVMTLLHQ